MEPGRRQPADPATVVPVLIAACGALIRIWQWFLDMPLWLDEAFLGNTVVTRDLRSLLGEKLDRAQSVPPAFLAALKSTVGLIGASDQVLHLVPLAAGVLSVVAAVWVARTVFETVPGQACFVGIISLSPTLLYYATELKPYGTDVLCTLLVTGLVATYEGTHRDRRLLLLAGSVIPWFSLPASLVLLAALAALALDLDATGRRRALPAAAGVVAMIGIAGIRSLAFAPATPDLKDNWAGGFAPLDADLPSWLADALLNLVHLTFRAVGVAGSSADPAWRSAPTVLLAVGVGAGAIALGRTHRRLQVFAALCVGLTLLGSVAEQYPFRGRLILFLVPVCALAAAGLVDRLAVERVEAGVAALAAASLAIAAPLARGHVIERGDVESALRYADAHAEDGDLLVPSAWSEPAFLFYERTVHTDLAQPGLLIDVSHDPDLFFRDVAPEIDSRAWLLFTHRFDDAQPLIDAIDERTLLLDEYVDRDLGLYLFDFSS